MRKFLRYLRIAFSATYLIACVLLIVLWVRSYWYHDGCYYFHGSGYIGVGSFRGNLLPFFEENPTAVVKWHVYSDPVDKDPHFRSFTWFNQLPRNFYVSIPHWFIALLIAALGSVPWLRWSKRFSVRTLLIATMLVALVLGLVVWSSRQ